MSFYWSVLPFRGMLSAKCGRLFDSFFFVDYSSFVLVQIEGILNYARRPLLSLTLKIIDDIKYARFFPIRQQPFHMLGALQGSICYGVRHLFLQLFLFWYTFSR